MRLLGVGREGRWRSRCEGWRSCSIGIELHRVIVNFDV